MGTLLPPRDTGAGKVITTLMPAIFIPAAIADRKSLPKQLIGGILSVFIKQFDLLERELLTDTTVSA
ncbi:MAG: hypothetical protein AAF542_17580 [Pseudomonadota bacterium]